MIRRNYFWSAEITGGCTGSGIFTIVSWLPKKLEISDVKEIAAKGMGVSIGSLTFVSIRRL